MAIYFLALVIAAYLQELQGMQINYCSISLYHKTNALRLSSLDGIRLRFTFVSVGSIVYQLTILTVNSDDAEVIGKTQATYIFGILIIFTLDNIVSTLEFRDRKQRAG